MDVEIYTNSLSGLPLRFPHPRKPILILPALIHRALHQALDTDPSYLFTPSGTASNGSSNSGNDLVPRTNELIGGRLQIPHPETIGKEDIPPPALDNTPPSSAASQVEVNPDTAEVEIEGDDTETTIKFHLVSSSPSTLSSSSSTTESALTSISQALHLLSNVKGIKRIDTLLIGFGGVDYRGEKTGASEFFGCGAEGLETPSEGGQVSVEKGKEVLEIWERLSDIFSGSLSASKSGNEDGHAFTNGQNEETNGNGNGNGKANGASNIVNSEIPKITTLGTLYLPLNLLKTLNESRKVKVNSLDTPDCHSLPKEYTGFARGEGIELWAGGGGEGSDPLPSSTLHNLLQEFHPILQPFLPPPQSTTNSSNGKTRYALSELIPLREDKLKYEVGEGGVEVRWVLGYTLVSKSRNLVKDKGYIVSARLSI